MQPLTTGFSTLTQLHTTADGRLLVNDQPPSRVPLYQRTYNSCLDMSDVPDDPPARGPLMPSRPPLRLDAPPRLSTAKMLRTVRRLDHLPGHWQPPPQTLREMLQARDWTGLEGRSWEPHPTRAKLETKARQNF